LIGRTIHHYEIISKIGEGGMGVVYKAHDQKLDRHVALKFLPPHLGADETAKKRFIREAQAASALEHSNICTVYDIGESEEGQLYMAMPFYEGESLRERLSRGPIPVAEALDVAAQLAGALSAAHDKGVVHRDVKPANVMVTPTGQTKLMDFGLARRGDATRMTKTGTTVGTAAYMSPEQARGEEPDARTDVWALGVVLYEMLTGRLPFRGDAEPAVVYSILNTDPELITSVRRDVTTSLEDVVERALTKDPARRYQSVQELLDALNEQREMLGLGIASRRSVHWKRFRRNRRLFYGSLSAAVVVLAAIVSIVFFQHSQAIDSIAVLPVDDLSGNGGDEAYFADSITNELISTLGKVGTIKVKSRASVMRFKGTDLSPKEIADRLGVDVLLQSTVIRDGDQVHFTTELIDPVNEQQLWAESYDQQMSGVLELYRDVAQAVVGQVNATLSPDAGAFLTGAREVDPDAYEAYLRGKFWFNKSYHTVEGLEKSRSYFRQAIDLDPNYAPAYVGLAESYIVLGCHGFRPSSEVLPDAVAAVSKAIDLDETLAEAYATLGHIKWEYEWDFYEAERLLTRSIELNASNTMAHHIYGVFMLMSGKYEKAIAEMRRAVELDPLAVEVSADYAMVLTAAGRCNDAMDRIEWTREMFPDWDYQYDLAEVFGCLGNYDDAVRVLEERADPQSPAYVMSKLGRYYTFVGRNEDARGLLDILVSRSERQYVPPFQIATIYAALGERDPALEWLERACDQRDPMVTRTNFLDVWKPFRGDPRFQDILRRIGFES
jgi:serine/threonine protein kinase/tetratricopeptide (TPR) repeat protein